MSPSKEQDNTPKKYASPREEVAVMRHHVDGSSSEDDHIVHTSDASAMHILQHAEVLSVVSEDEYSHCSNNNIKKMSKHHGMFATRQNLHDEHDDEMPEVPSLNVPKESEPSGQRGSKTSSRTLRHKSSSSFSDFLRRSGTTSFGYSTKEWSRRQNSFFEWMAAVDDVETEDKDLSLPQKIAKIALHTYRRNEVFVLVVCAILLARAYPPLGAVYFAPQVTSTWIAVIFIFVLAGIGLKTEEFSHAFKRVPFNVFVQCFCFGTGSSMVFGVTRILVSMGAINNGLADGMVVCSCLPMTISSVSVMTKMADGDEAAAIFNSAFGNMLAVVVSPALILLFLGVAGLDMNVSEVFGRLALRVIVPVVAGQIIQKRSPWTTGLLKRKKLLFQRAQLYAVIWIVYTVFCKTFQYENDTTIVDIFTMILLQFLFYCTLMFLSWYSLMFLFPDEPKLRVMGFFGCTHKTVAMGVPMIGSIYENDPLVGLYTLPLLVWYPLQLVVGSFLIPRLQEFVKREEQRLEREDIGDDGDDLTLEGDSLNEFSSGPSKGDKAEPKLLNAKEIVRKRYENLDLEVGAGIFRCDTDTSEFGSEEDLPDKENQIFDHQQDERSRAPGPDTGDEAPPSKPIHSSSRNFMTCTHVESADGVPNLQSQCFRDKQDVEHSTKTQSTSDTSVETDVSKNYGQPREGSNHSKTDGDTVESFKSRRKSRKSSRSSKSSGSKKKRSRSQAECISDHSFYQVEAVYYEETVPRRVPEGSYCRGGCSTRIATHFNEIGILPSESSPVYICRRCQRHVVCYVCWNYAKTPQWPNDSLWNLYG